MSRVHNHLCFRIHWIKSGQYRLHETFTWSPIVSGFSFRLLVSGYHIVVSSCSQQLRFGVNETRVLFFVQLCIRRWQSYNEIRIPVWRLLSLIMYTYPAFSCSVTSASFVMCKNTDYATEIVLIDRIDIGLTNPSKESKTVHTWSACLPYSLFRCR